MIYLLLLCSLFRWQFYPLWCLSTHQFHYDFLYSCTDYIYAFPYLSTFHFQSSLAFYQLCFQIFVPSIHPFLVQIWPNSVCTFLNKSFFVLFCFQLIRLQLKCVLITSTIGSTTPGIPLPDCCPYICTSWELSAKWNYEAGDSAPRGNWTSNNRNSKSENIWRMGAKNFRNRFSINEVFKGLTNMNACILL